MGKIEDKRYLEGFNRIGKNDTQNVFTPPCLIRRMLSRITFDKKSKIFVWYNVEILLYLVNEVGLPQKNIYIYTNTQDKLILRNQGYNVIYQEDIDFDKMSKLINVKFDVVLGNPPYHKKVGPKKTEALWPKFVEKSFEICKEGGYISLIHPGGWRNVTGNYKKLQEKIKNKNLIFLSINSVDDGQTMFKVATPYDWYILQNTQYQRVTEIKFQDEAICETDISNMTFIPNNNFNTVISLVAKDYEETVEVLYSRSGYGTDKQHISKVRTEQHIYPCVYSILSNGTVNLMYSSINNNGHFGIPKLILGNGANPTCFIDYTGQYAMTQFAYGIVDTVENLEKIKEVIISDKFQKVNLATKYVATVGNPLAYPKILKTFRKDFWREFIDE